MSAEEVAVISAAVVVATQLAKWAKLPDQRAPLVVVGFSLVGVILWGYSTEPAFDRALIWPYFAGWLTVAAGAAGIYGFTRSMPEAITATKEPPKGAMADPVAKMD